jgi:pilus assembly protein Flp/PilA
VRLIAKLTSDFLRDEYALIATGLSIVILAAVTGIGSAVKKRFRCGERRAEAEVARTGASAGQIFLGKYTLTA